MMYPKRVGEWLLDNAPRAYNAGLFFEGRNLALNTLYPLIPALAEWGEMANDPVLTRFAVWQLQVHFSHLFDPATGFLRHAWNADEKRRWGECWAQGNAFALLSVAETLHWLPSASREARSLREQWWQLLETVLSAQRDSGAWGLLLDDPRSPDDFLATALFLTALEVYPWEGAETFPREATERGFHWLQQQVGATGHAPPVFPSLSAGYRERYLRLAPRLSPAGDGALLGLLAERWRRQERERLQGIERGQR